MERRGNFENQTDHNSVRNSLLLRAWQGFSIFVTIPLILKNLNSETQGLYYFFLAVASTQTFFEMGLGLIATIRASHEWVDLKIMPNGCIEGKEEARARLRQLCNISVNFALMSAIIFLGISTLVGTQFISDSSSTGQFTLFIIVISCTMILNSLLYIIEGCNQVGTVAVFRIVQSLIGSLILWLSLEFGCGIYSIIFQATSTFLCIAAFIFFFKRNFFSSIYIGSRDSHLTWKNDFFPHQWRLAIQSIFNLLVFPFFQLLAFKMLGPIESGKFGLTVQIALGIQGLSLVFISAKIPYFSMLAARGFGAEQKRDWKIQLVISTVFMFICFFIYILGLIIASKYFEVYYIRVLSIRETLILFAGLLATPYIFGVASITRAHKIEKFTLIGVLSGFGYSTIAVAMCSFFGSEGIVIAYTALTLLFLLPLTHRVMKTFINERMTA